MYLVVICNPDDQWEAERISQEAIKLGHVSKVFNYENFQFSVVGKRIEIFYNQSEWKLPKISVFRSANYQAKNTRYDELAYVLRDYIDSKGGKILNFEAMKIGPFGKLRQQYELTKSPLSNIETYYGINRAPYFPIVQKPLLGSSGDGVRLVNDESELILDKLSVYQKVMERGCDYRVIVIGGKAIGAIERRAGEDSFVANVSKGATARRVELSEEIMQLAEEVCTLFGLEYAGVDLIKDIEGKWYVLEVNRFAQFRGFEMATKINVARIVVEYLCKKV